MDDSYIEYSPKGDEKELIRVNSGEDLFNIIRAEKLDLIR